MGNNVGVKVGRGSIPQGRRRVVSLGICRNHPKSHLHERSIKS